MSSCASPDSARSSSAFAFTEFPPQNASALWSGRPWSAFRARWAGRRRSCPVPESREPVERATQQDVGKNREDDADVDRLAGIDPAKHEELVDEIDHDRHDDDLA